MMISCPDCGGLVSDRAKYCKACGYPIGLYHMDPFRVSSAQCLKVCRSAEKYANLYKAVHFSEDSYTMELIPIADPEQPRIKAKIRLCNGVLDRDNIVEFYLYVREDNYSVLIQANNGNVRNASLEQHELITRLLYHHNK